jgi:Rrf2 family protein
VPRTTQDLAKRTGVPAAYLSKVLQCLSRANLVRAQRGLHGGYTLARPPAEMTVWDVFQAMSPLPPAGGCLLGVGEMGCRECCPLRQPLADLTLQIEALFRRTRVADLLHPQAVAGPGLAAACEKKCAGKVAAAGPDGRSVPREGVAHAPVC